MAAISPELKKALKDLLDVTSGKQYDPRAFQDATWGFIRRFCDIPPDKGQLSILTECSGFVRRSTEDRTRYARVFEAGQAVVRAMVYTEEQPAVKPVVLTEGGQSLSKKEQYRVQRFSGPEDPLVRLQQARQKKNMIGELEPERDQLKQIIKWLNADHCLINVHKDYGRQALETWLAAIEDLIKDGNACHADGCHFLAEFRRCKLENVESEIIDPAFEMFGGAGWVEPVQEAAKILMEKLETTPVQEKVTTTPAVTRTDSADSPVSARDLASSC